MQLSDPGEPERAGKQVLFDLVSPFKWRVALLSLVSLAAAVLEAVFILLLTGIGMTLVSGDSQIPTVMGLTFSVQVALGAAAISLLARVALSLFGVSLAAELSARITVWQRKRLSHAYLRTEWSVQHREPAGRLQELLTTFVRRMTDSVTTLTTAISAGLSLLAFLVTGIAVDPLSAAAVLLALGVVSAVLVPLRRAIQRRSRRNADAGMDFATAVSEFGSLGLEMQVFGARTAFEEDIDALNQAQSETQRQTDILRGALPQVYMSLAYGAILAAVALLTVFQSVDLATVGAIMLLMIRAISYGQQLATASGSLATSLPFLEKIERAVQHYQRQHRIGGVQKPEAALPIRVAGVSFHYPEGGVVLRDIDIQLEAGETVGVIGPSGAGKSTLAQLLLGLRMPTSGDVSMGDTSTQDIDPLWWVDKTTFVPQDARLLTGTIAENIRFFREDITDAEIRTATELANVWEEIAAMPDGIETHLGQRGGQLSGGQRQRISIARALVRKPEFLVLDEPTSALDGESETLVRDTLEALRGEITVLIIAHRMSTLDFCDRIMVIEEGRITAFDTPERLRVTSDFYRRALTTAGLF